MDMVDVDLHGILGTFKLDVSFKLPLSGVNVLFGPSGCGKTSVLRAIAGLNRLSGHVHIGSEVWQDKNQFLPVYKRAIGYVFQEASLFPHLSVRRNLIYGMPKQQKIKSSYFDEIVDMLGISALIDRAPYHLSGGERQRVAIGRALLSNPSVLLMDEPLSALDNETREEILPYLERLRDHLKQPIFYITHDMREVERLADYLVLINNGSVLSAGKLETLQADLSLPLAKKRKAAVTISAQPGNHEHGLLTLNVNGGHFLAPITVVNQNSKLRLRIKASDVSLSVEQPNLSSILNILPCKILSKQDLESNEKLVLLGLGKDGNGAHILSRLTNYSWHKLSLQIGAQVYAQIKGVAILSALSD